MIPHALHTLRHLVLQARAQKRRVLYEHEVYTVLHTLGISTPRCRFVRLDERPSLGDLEELGARQLVIKAIGPKLLHRTKIGGITTVASDLPAVHQAITEMEARLGDHPQVREGGLDGFLLVERLTSRLEGSGELMISARRTDDFGPVVLLSRGGVAVEELARGRELNLALPPFGAADLERLLEGAGLSPSDAGPSARQQAHQQTSAALQHLGAFMLEATTCADMAPQHCLADLELNPVVFDESGNLWALDGLATLVAVNGDASPGSASPGSAGNAADPLTMPGQQREDATRHRASIGPLVHPRGVAVVGVSATDPQKTGNLIADRIAACNRDDLFLVNPAGGSVTLQGRQYCLYPSLAKLPRSVDLAVVTVPAAHTPAVVEEAVQAGVRAVILIPGGFSEAGAGHELEREILSTIHHTETRVLGPNCMGILSRAARLELNTLFIPAHKLPIPETSGVANDRLALISQSGAATLSLMDDLRPAVTPRLLVSFGNQLDIDAADLVEQASMEPEVDVIGLYLEGFSALGGRRLCESIKKSRADVIVYKAGRTSAGAVAAASHTASIAGDYAVAEASLRGCGAIVANDLAEFADLLRTFCLLRNRPRRGLRVAGLVNAGFEGTYAADQIRGLQPATLSEETVRTLRSVLPPFVGIHAFIDVTPMSDERIYEACARALLLDPDVDAVFISVVPHTARLRTTHSEMEGGKDGLLTRQLAHLMRTCETPLVLSINGGEQFDAFRQAAQNEGIPTFPDALRAMRALSRWLHRA